MNANINITMTPQVPTVQRFFHVPNKFQAQNFQQKPHLFAPHNRQHLQQPQQNIEFDGKRLRKAVTRKTVDYNSSVLKYLESRVWQRDYRDRRITQPDPAYYIEMMPPLSMPDNPINAVTTKFVRTSTNKMRCPIFCVAWTPEGRRLVTGASSGEFTLWNGLTFNFETILQAHDSSVRCMVWSHSDLWMVTGDHAGYVKYWQSNMNNVKMFQAHKEPLRGISFCPVDTKFVTCSDDGTVRIWDFLKCFEEKILRGHGADVKCVDWHPQKSLLVSGSKDSQQPIKLWDPKTGQSLATVHAHKNTVMDTKWNKNGNWLLTASRDHLIKLFDIRNLSQELQTFRGHKKEATTLAWHPVHEGLFASGGSDGSVMFWVAGADKEVGCMEQAHDSCVWSLAWHPLGHILCSGSNDHSSKFWTRNRPGDRMRDKYNLNTLPKGQDDAADYDDSGVISASIPGMGLEYGIPDHLKLQENSFDEEIVIPGLDFTSEDAATEKSLQQKKIPFSKPIPKQFQQQWMDSKQPLLLAPPLEDRNNDQNQNTSQSAQEQYEANAPSNEMQYQEHHDNSFQQEQMRTENQSHETWRTYSEANRETDHNHGDRNIHENGAEMHNPELRVNFEGQNNAGPPPNRGQFQIAMPEEKFPPNNGHPGGPPPVQNQYDKDMRFQGGNMEGPRPHLNSHMDDMGGNYAPHKRSWQSDGSGGNDNQFALDHQTPEYGGRPPQMEYGPPRHHMRPPSGPMFFSGRGPRGGPYRGGPRSPYRIVNRGRGLRTGYPE